MNKQIIAALMAVGFGLSAGSAIAAPTAFTGNATVTNAECSLLAETVTLGASKNVHGAYDCIEAANLVRVGACSSGGSRQVGAACVDLDPATPGDQLPLGCAAPGGFSTIPDFKAFFTSSKGGVMAEYNLGGRCEATRIVAIGGFTAAP